MTKDEMEYWNDRKDEVIKCVPVPDENYRCPTKEEQEMINADIERILKEYHS